MIRPTVLRTGTALVARNGDIVECIRAGNVRGKIPKSWKLIAKKETVRWISGGAGTNRKNLY